MSSRPVTHETLSRLTRPAFVSQGLPEADARKVAGLMADADLQGSDGHGVMRLPQYIKRIRAGGINKQRKIRFVHERSAMAAVDTNPIAAGIPTANEPPVVLDMATTVAAYGEVKAKAKPGEQMPVGWMIDREGKPLLDPKRAVEGFLLPIGEHKGYGLALLVGLLAGTLGGAAMGRDVIDFSADHVTVTNTGQAILVIDRAAFGDPAHFKHAVDKLVRDIRGSARLPGVDRIWLPGEQSHEKRVRYRMQGIPIASALFDELNTLAAELGIATLGKDIPA